MAEDTVQVLEEFINLVSKKIDSVARRVRSGPATQTAVAELLDGLSVAAQKSASDFADAIGGLPEEGRQALLSSLDTSGVTNTARLLTPLLSTEDIDWCLVLHESAKTLYAAETVAELWGLEIPVIGMEELSFATILEGTALAADIAAQICDWKASQAADVKLNEMEDAVIRLEEKINYIMDLPEGQPTPRVPPDTKPASLTEIRTMLEAEEETIIRLEQKINYIMDLPEGAPMPETPPDTKPVSLTILEKMLEACKKFYKFEGSFRPSFEKDKQLIRIGPLSTAQLPTPPVPILVTGFIDLIGMQDNDVVTITTKVLEPTPSPQYIIWRVKTFTGRQASGLKHFQDFSDLLEVPGDGVELLIAQSASSHNFDNAFLLTIPYQFLVETTVLPDFNVS